MKEQNKELEEMIDTYENIKYILREEPPMSKSSFWLSTVFSFFLGMVFVAYTDVGKKVGLSYYGTIKWTYEEYNKCYFHAESTPTYCKQVWVVDENYSK